MKTHPTKVQEPLAINSTVFWLRDTVGPDGKTLAVNVRVPAKPLRLRTVIRDGPKFPGEMNRVLGLETSAKSAEADGATIVTNTGGER